MSEWVQPSTRRSAPIIAAVESLKPAKPVIFAGLDEGAPVPPAYVAALRALGVANSPRPTGRSARWRG